MRRPRGTLLALIVINFVNLELRHFAAQAPDFGEVTAPDLRGQPRILAANGWRFSLPHVVLRCQLPVPWKQLAHVVNSHLRMEEDVLKIDEVVYVYVSLT